LSTSQVSPDVRAIIRRRQECAPVKVVALAQDLGLRVFREDLRSGISGKLYRDTGSQAAWSISVNAKEPDVRQRFTIAHEIGHFVLHLGSVSDSVEDDVFYRSNLTSRQEAEANAFAADILMPWELINRLTDSGQNTPEAIARGLEVSQVAMNIRLGLPT
jgi:Zn-dependent peptidase ImmA (M78 family)